MSLLNPPPVWRRNLLFSSLWLSFVSQLIEMPSLSVKHWIGIHFSPALPPSKLAENWKEQGKRTGVQVLISEAEICSLCLFSKGSVS